MISYQFQISQQQSSVEFFMKNIIKICIQHANAMLEAHGHPLDDHIFPDREKMLKLAQGCFENYRGNTRSVTIVFPDNFTRCFSRTDTGTSYTELLNLYHEYVKLEE